VPQALGLDGDLVVVGGGDDDPSGAEIEVLDRDELIAKAASVGEVDRPSECAPAGRSGEARVEEHHRKIRAEPLEPARHVVGHVDSGRVDALVVGVVGDEVGQILIARGGALGAAVAGKVDDRGICGPAGPGEILANSLHDAVPGSLLVEQQGDAAFVGGDAVTQQRRDYLSITPGTAEVADPWVRVSIDSDDHGMKHGYSSMLPAVSKSAQWFATSQPIRAGHSFVSCDHGF